MSASEMKYVEGLINNMKVIQKILPPSPLRLLGSGSRQQTLSRPGSSSGGASLLLRKRLTPTLLVLLAALAVGLLFLLPGGLLQAQQDNMTTVSYAENGEGPVATFTATDPEGDTVTWDLETGADMEEFEISEDGVLTFESPPDFEAATGSGADNTNIYEVTVTATDDADRPNTETFAVTVEVTDVDEDGEVSWTVDPDGAAEPTLSANDPDGTPPQKPIMQFQVGATLVASMTDGDMDGAEKSVTVATGRWQWYRSSSKTSLGSIIADETNARYDVTTDDQGRYLHVKAFYNVGTGREESASLASDYPVLADRSNNDAPEFASTSVAREVNEGDKGITVGAPVTATDDVRNALNYVLSGTDAASFEIDQMTGQIKTTADLDYEMPIDINHPGSPGNAAGNNEYIVTVTATDSAGAPTATVATVTIKIKNVDQKPGFTTGNRMVTVNEDITVLDGDNNDSADDFMGENVYAATDPEESLVALSLMGNDGGMFRLNSARVLTFTMAPDYEEPMDANEDNVYEVTVRATDSTRMYADRMVTVTVIDVNEAPEIMEGQGRNSIDYIENGTDPVATFTATDPEGDTVTWDLETGADMEEFEISEDGVLTFESPPDFEAATGSGAGNTNIYEVTVTATDDADRPNTETFAVTVEVTDVDEDGEVSWTVDPDGAAEPTLSANDPDGTPPQKPIMQFQVGATLVASMTDGDVTGAVKTNVNNLTWQWYRSSSKTSLGSIIADETNARYDVTTSDQGRYLHVKASYNVGTGREESASLASDYPVLADRSNNDAPEFASTSVAREVNEGDKGITVGAPVTATDDVRNALNYVLSGTDAASFEIDQMTGQIKTTADLDYEMPIDINHPGSPGNAAGNNEYIVTVTATDSAGAPTATVATVTIKIKNVDQKPGFTTGNRMVTVNEDITVLDGDNNDSADDFMGENVYAATDPEESLVTLSLMGNDGGMFRLNSARVLTFTMAPDYEEPMDANEDNVYEVTVRATDSTRMYADRMVTVTVIDVNEAPMIIVGGLGISGMSTVSYDENGTGSVATYTASGPEAASARWSLSGDDSGDFSIGQRTGVLTFRTSPDYEDPADADTNNVYMVTVKATDSENNMAELNVMVRITDVEGVLAISGQSSIDYDENGTGAVTTYTASGPDAGPAVWSLSGDDAGDFSISTAGVLSFNSPPDFEAPVDADTNNEYMVTVEATGSENSMDELSVTVTVTDVEGVLAISGLSSIDYAENGTGAVTTYTASVSDAGPAVWSLSGDDAGDFSISTAGVLSFNSPPDFEAPADADTNNEYIATVKAEAGGEMETLEVTVMVTNMEEDGTVTLSSMTPVAGTAVTASLTDPDMVMEDSVMWQWSKSMTMDGTFMDIPNAMSMSYTPTAADGDYHLRATATYADGYDSGNEEMATTTNAVVSNSAPTFTDGATATRMVDENSEAGTAVGAPVAATDADTDDTLTYSLSGGDATYFSIDTSTGQITVGAGAMLDYEMKPSYMVTVMVDDGSGASNSSASINVTINVTDVDEEQTLLERYDADDSGQIDKPEVIQAINEYLEAGPGAPSRDDVIAVINLYLG